LGADFRGIWRRFGDFGGDYRGILVIIDTELIINGDYVSVKKGSRAGSSGRAGT
jgi:hypothetical protein